MFRLKKEPKQALQITAPLGPGSSQTLEEIMNVCWVVMLLAVVFSGCSKTPPADEWWVSMTTPGKSVIKVFRVDPREKKLLVIDGAGRTRLGLLVRSVWELKEDIEKSGNSRGGVFLAQDGTDSFIGTTYSASNLFNLTSGRSFTVENRSNIGTDVMIYSDAKP